RPLVTHVLYTGSPVTIAAGHSLGPVAVSFDIKPAFRLPHLGTFQVAFRAPCLSRLWLLECGNNPFAEGNLQWNRAAECPPWTQVTPMPSVDLAVAVDLCDHDPGNTTPAVGTSWGWLKSTYR